MEDRDDIEHESLSGPIWPRQSSGSGARTLQQLTSTWVAIARKSDGIELPLAKPVPELRVFHDMDFALPWPGSDKNWYRVTDTCNWADGPDTGRHPGH